MIKQRNANILDKNNPTFNNNKHQQSPFNRQNPYRVKAQFYSQRKKSSTLTSATTDSKERKASRQSNPESLLYRRDYKQNPPTMYIGEYRKLNDNFIQVKNNMLMRNLSRNTSGVNEQLQQQEYRLRLKQYVADKFCPSDPYLQIVKDKFAYLSTSNNNSEFQNMMKMSNLGISNLVTRNKYNNNYTSNVSSRSGVGSYKDRMNPFYRKSLISSLGNNSNYNLQQYNSYNRSNSNNNNNNNKWQYFPQISTTGDNNNYSHVLSSYPYNSVNNASPSHSPHYEQMASNVYHISIPPNDPSKYYHNHHIKTSSYSQQQLSQSQSRVSNYNNNNTNYNNNNNGLQSINDNNNSVSPKSSLAASFGPGYQWKVNGMMKPYIDAVIQNHLQDPLNIQAQAPKQIKVKGKTFYVQRVNRFL